jgi:alcohol oxidase
LTCGHAQTETYQVAGAGPTHGTDGPLKVSLGTMIVDCAEQFLQVARALDPARASLPSNTDTNDLSTINVFTVGVLELALVSP